MAKYCWVCVLSVYRRRWVYFLSVKKVGLILCREKNSQLKNIRSLQKFTVTFDRPSKIFALFSQFQPLPVLFSDLKERFVDHSGFMFPEPPTWFFPRIRGWTLLLGNPHPVCFKGVWNFRTKKIRGLKFIGENLRGLKSISKNCYFSEIRKADEIK